MNNTFGADRSCSFFLRASVIIPILTWCYTISGASCRSAILFPESALPGKSSVLYRSERKTIRQSGRHRTLRSEANAAENNTIAGRPENTELVARLQKQLDAGWQKALPVKASKEQRHALARVRSAPRDVGYWAPMQLTSPRRESYLPRAHFKT